MSTIGIAPLLLMVVVEVAVVRGAGGVITRKSFEVRKEIPDPDILRGTLVILLHQYNIIG